MIATRTNYWLDSRPMTDARSCGDFAACLPLDAERFAIIIGDVAGRGPAAGAAAATVLAYTKKIIGSRLSLHAALERIDDHFSRSATSEAVQTASLFVAVVDGQDQVLDYASAGHEAVVHFMTGMRHDHLAPTGPLLGLCGLRRTAFQQRRVRISTESVVVLVTDGITEARHYATGTPQFFGSSGVVRAFAEARRLPIDPARAINDSARQHAGRLRDDATALVVALGDAGRTAS